MPEGDGKPENLRVLVVDDERDMCRLLEFNLEDAGFEVKTAHTGAEGLLKAARFQPHVIVLDRMLPDIPGTEACRHLRQDATLADTGILMVTALGRDQERVEGLEVGADDYVVKPFHMREVVLRVQALARRCGERRAARSTKGQSVRRLRWRGLELDPGSHRAFLDTNELVLRPMEFRLLSVLMARPGDLLPRERLLQEVWGIEADVHTRTVDTHIRRLRQKLGPYGEGIETVYGLGYRFADSE